MKRTLFFSILLQQLLLLMCTLHSAQPDHVIVQDKNSFPQDTSYLIVLSGINFNSYKSILDIGCGSGAITYYIASRTCGFVTGIDMSPEIINQARQSYQANNIAFSAHNVGDWLISKSKYDLIVSINCLHWVEDLKLVLNKISQGLQPNGTFLAALQHQDHYLYKPMLEVSKKKRWRTYFGKSAEAPWYPQTKQSLDALIKETDMIVKSLFVWHRKLAFRNLEIFQNWLASWMDYIPHMARLQADLKTRFIAEVAKNFLRTLTLKPDGSFEFTTPVLIVHAKKK